MSYDIKVFTEVHHFSSNYTSNVYQMYASAYKVAVENEKKQVEEGKLPYRLLYFNDFKGALNCDRETAMRALIFMIAELNAEPDKYLGMNPENGWGNYNGAVKFLSDALVALGLHENAKVRIEC